MHEVCVTSALAFRWGYDGDEADGDGWSARTGGRHHGGLSVAPGVRRASRVRLLVSRPAGLGAVVYELLNGVLVDEAFVQEPSDSEPLGTGIPDGVPR